MSSGTTNIDQLPSTSSNPSDTPIQNNLPICIPWEKTNNSDDDYNINHTASVFMLDRDGDFSGTISWGENRKVIIEKIINLLN